MNYGGCARRIGVLAAVGALVGGASAFGASSAGAASPSGAGANRGAVWKFWAVVGAVVGICLCGAVPAYAQGTFVPGSCAERLPASVAQVARCGSLVVPENRANPSGRAIRLAVAIIPAMSSTPAPDPLVYMSGGPGEDPILVADLLVDAGLHADRDLIVMSQRGHFSSTPELGCPEIDKFRDVHIGLRYGAASTGRRGLRATRACRRRLVERGVDLSGYNTLENAADFADLRSALGIGEWNVYGASYGTELALTYMREHPAGIRSVTLDGLVPPSAITPGTFWPSAKEGLDGVFRACRNERRCRNRYPGIGRTFRRLVRELEADPITTKVRLQSKQVRKVVLDGGVLLNWAIRTGSNVRDGRLVPWTVDRLARGRPKPIARQWGSLWTAREFRGLFGYGLTFGVTCSEWVPYETRSRSLAMARQAFPGFPDSVLAQTPQLPFLRENCRVWDVPKAPASQRAITQSAIPTLVVSGGFDSKTGAQWGDFAARTLSNSTVITIPGMGHGAVVFSPCAQAVARSFLTTPGAPDTSCVGQVKPARFK